MVKISPDHKGPRATSVAGRGTCLRGRITMVSKPLITVVVPVVQPPTWRIIQISKRLITMVIARSPKDRVV